MIDSQIRSAVASTIVLALGLSASSARAEERPVIHSGVEPEGVVEAWLQSETGLQRRDVSLPSLRATPGAWVVGGAEITGCAGPPTNVGDLRQLHESAAGMVAYLRVPEAREALRRLDLLLACLAEPVDAALAAELYQLRGYADMLGKDAEAATRSFRTALSFDAELAWNDQHNPDFGAAVIESLRAAPAPERVGLEVVPAVDGVVTTVNGRPSAEVAPGAQLVQLTGPTIQSMWVRVEGGATLVSLVVPSSLGPDAMLGWDQPGVQDMWRKLVQASPMHAGPVELIADGHVHLLQPAGSSWEVTARLRGSSEGDPVARRRAAFAWYGSAGLTTLSGGALLVAASYGMTELEESARADLLSPEEAEAMRGRINRNLLFGYSLIGAGVGVGGVGALVMRAAAGGGGSLQWVATW